MLLTLNKRMKDQRKQPGALLKELRKRLGYSIEDWANVFDTDPVVIASIEAGHEMSAEFLVALIGWIINGLEHPQTPTEILPDGWEDNLPLAISTLLRTMEQKNLLIADLQNTHNIQKTIIEQDKAAIKGHHSQIENYLQLVAQQHEKIKSLEEVQQVEEKTSKAKGASAALMGIVMLLTGGLLFNIIDNIQQTPPRALVAEQPVAVRQIAPLKVITKPRQVPPQPAPKLTLRKVATPKKVPVLSKPVVKQKPEKKQATKGNNSELFNLLVVNADRTIPEPQKYTSEKGESILKFNNPTKEKMVIVINNQAQQEIHRDTTQSQQYLLDVSKYVPDNYYYWMYPLSNATDKTMGNFTVKDKE